MFKAFWGEGAFRIAETQELKLLKKKAWFVGLIKWLESDTTMDCIACEPCIVSFEKTSSWRALCITF